MAKVIFRKANAEHVAILKDGVGAWNQWRDVNPGITPNLSSATLDGSRLPGINLRRATLDGVQLVNANLQKANLEEASLVGAWLDGVNLRDARLRGADLFGAYLSHADLTGADLQMTSLERVNMVNTTLHGANVSGAHIYGISAWDLHTDKGTLQTDLVITASSRVLGRPAGESVLVDDIEVAQFVNLMLNNEKIRHVLSVIGRKGVLILGRFTPPDRKAVLDAVRAKLRELDYVPMMFDFAKVDDRSFTETIKVLAGMSRFVIADVTDSKAAPLELQATVPDYMVPFVPILREGERPFSMLVDLQIYEWVMPVKTYRDITHLLENLERGIVAPALELHARLQAKKAKGLQIESL